MGCIRPLPDGEVAEVPRSVLPLLPVVGLILDMSVVAVGVTAAAAAATTAEELPLPPPEAKTAAAARMPPALRLIGRLLMVPRLASSF